MPDLFDDLVNAIAAGSKTSQEAMTAAVKGIFGARFQKRNALDLDGKTPPIFRNAYARGEGESSHVPYAAFINPNNPSSGAYGGASLVWFPSDKGCLINFCIGTRGLSPDEGILTRPGHRRRIAGLRKYLVRHGCAEAWARQDPVSMGKPLPDSVKEAFSAWGSALNKYGSEVYCAAIVVPSDVERAKIVVRAFVDLYAREREWDPLAAVKDELDSFIAELESGVFEAHTAEQVATLLNSRRFVVLEGPPGTGKTRLAEKILQEHYAGNGLVTQFHPSTTYEDFVAGLSPDIKQETLRFDARPGCLLQAAKKTESGPALLIIDEINRADLGRVLGEAIYLFESGSGTQRSVRLPHAIDGKEHFTLPENLHVLATMNTADRSVSRMDLAIRRRFAFVPVMPDRNVVAQYSTETGLRLFDQMCHVFFEYAPEDAFSLLPGHSYFLVPDRDENRLRTRLRYELIPLLDEYIREGYLGSATAALHAVRDRFVDAASFSSNS